MKKSHLMRALFLTLMLLYGSVIIAQITSQEAVKLIQRGINLGNTLEPEQEGGWNNGPAQEYYFDLYKKAGFTCVRIPIRWDKHTDTIPPYTINAAWLDRVEQVVDWGLKRDLYVIINLHHEEPFKADYANQYVRYDSIWSQISRRFKDKSEKLFFEIVNEPNGLTQDDINDFNLTVHGIIRKNNPTRIIIYSGNGWASANDLQNAAIPDTSDRYLMGYYHSYDPWEFAGNGNGTWGSSSDINQMISRMKSVQDWSEQNSIPVLIGEFGAQKKCEYNSRMFYYANYVEQAIDHNQAFCVWDDGGDFQVMLRKDSLWNDIKDILIYTSDSSPTTVKANVIENSRVDLTWKSRSDSKRRIYVERRTLKTQFAEIAEVGSVSSTTDVTEYTDTNVVQGTTYYYRVVEEYNNTSVPSYPVSAFVDYVSIKEKINNVLQVFPNPVSNVINISCANGFINDLKLYDSSGRLLISRAVNGSSVSINTTGFNEGLYIIIADTDQGLLKSTFIKQ